VREKSQQAVDALHELGIQVVMITGDAQLQDGASRPLGCCRYRAVEGVAT
jgi:cation transport ATPase